MTIEVLNHSDGLALLVSKAGRLSAKRYVCFTKKYLNDEFVLMTDSDDLSEVRSFYDDLPVSCYNANPRLVFDQLEGLILDTHNPSLVMKTMEMIIEQEEGKRFVYPFKSPSSSWSSTLYFERINH